MIEVYLLFSIAVLESQDTYEMRRYNLSFALARADAEPYWKGTNPYDVRRDLEKRGLRCVPRAPLDGVHRLVEVWL